MRIESIDKKCCLNCGLFNDCTVVGDLKLIYGEDNFYPGAMKCSAWQDSRNNRYCSERIDGSTGNQ